MKEYNDLTIEQLWEVLEQMKYRKTWSLGSWLNRSGEHDPDRVNLLTLLRSKTVRLEKEYLKLKEELPEKINQFQDESNLANNYSVLQKERDNLSQRVNTLMRQLAELKRDKTATYLSDSLSSHIIVEDFKYLKTQGFHSVSNQIFEYLSGQVPSSIVNVNRKNASARIKSILAHQILVRESQLLAEVKVKEAIDILLKSISSLPVSVMYESLTKTIESIALNDTEGGIVTEQICIKKIVQLIAKEVFNLLENEIDMPTELQSTIINLTQKGVELARKVANTDPPGELWIAKKGELFDQNMHEVIQGCKEEGEIEYTVYPGYRVGTRILDKAVVFTSFSHDGET